jgi:hypothetical protein
MNNATFKQHALDHGLSAMDYMVWCLSELMSPEEYPREGMGKANVGPEFTENDCEGLLELCAIETNFNRTGMTSKPAGLRKIIWNAVIESVRWKSGRMNLNQEDIYANPGDVNRGLLKPVALCLGECGRRSYEAL